MSNLTAELPEIVVGRECGSCSLCCKLIAVTELNKSEGTWCLHCSPGKGGCLIYEDRPPSCKGFHCGWRQSTRFGPEWTPTTAKMVIAAESDGNRITIYVDPSFPTNWRREPYHSQLSALAIELAQVQRQLLVRINDRVIALLPNKEIDLGRCEEEDQVVVTRNRRTGEWGARIVRAENIPLNERGKWIASGW